MSTKENKNDVEDIVRRYADMVYRLALGRTGKKEDAEDVFQEVFLRLAKHNEPWDSEEHLKNWLLRVTVNCCNSLYRRGERKYETTLEELPEIGVEDQYAEESPIYELLWALPEKYSTVLHLFYYEELSVREIAQMKKCREGTVKSLLSRGRKLLEQSIQKSGV